MAGQSSLFLPDPDVNITYEDHRKIIKYATRNARLGDLTEDLKAKQDELKKLLDAGEELVLMDEDSDEKIPYFVGEIFVYLNIKDALETLEEAKAEITREIKTLESRCSDLKREMSDLKAELYAKYGNKINLEVEEE